MSMSIPVNSDGSSSNFGDTIYNQPIIMQPISTNTKNDAQTNTVGTAPNAQTIDYWLYRTISQTPSTCADCGTNFTF